MMRIKLNDTVLSVILAVLVGMAATAAAAPKDKGADSDKGGKPGKATQWYVKMVLVVEDDSGLAFDDRSGVFGRIEGAGDLRDTHDVPVFTNASTARAAIAFSVEGSEDVSQFLSSYTAPGADRRTWDFTVYSDKPTGEATLAWQGIFAISGEAPFFETELDPGSNVFKSLILVDRETGELVSAVGKKGVLNDYRFNMGGKQSRHFRWVQGSVTAEDLQAVPGADATPQLHAEAGSVQGEVSGLVTGPPAIVPHVSNHDSGVVTSQPAEREK